jgi:cytochrome c oxidase cbb3-type subunit III
LLFLVSVLTALSASSLMSQSAAQKSIRGKSQLTSANTAGRAVFASSCAGCHGLEGRGSERAPNIAQKPEVQRLSDAQLMHIIQEGVPGTGMPAFHSLASTDVSAVVVYLRALQGTNKAVSLPGNPIRGKTVFDTNAGCSECHMVAGSGGFIASDLTSYGRSHSADEIREAIVKPGLTTRSTFVVTRAGQQYTGRIRNEDNFSLQLQSLDGTFHFFLKADLDRLDYNSQPLMPADYGSKLDSKDLDDLVSFLINSARKGDAAPSREEDE